MTVVTRQAPSPGALSDALGLEGAPTVGSARRGDLGRAWSYGGPAWLGVRLHGQAPEVPSEEGMGGWSEGRVGTHVI